MSEKFNLGDKIILKPWDEVILDPLFDGYRAFGINESIYKSLSKKPRTILDIIIGDKIIGHKIKDDVGFTWYIPESFIQKAI